jgi:hypothetical protein
MPGDQVFMASVGVRLLDASRQDQLSYPLGHPECAMGRDWRLASGMAAVAALAWAAGCGGDGGSGATGSAAGTAAQWCLTSRRRAWRASAEVCG